MKLVIVAKREARAGSGEDPLAVASGEGDERIGYRDGSRVAKPFEKSSSELREFPATEEAVMGVFDSIMSKIFRHGSTSMGSSSGEPQTSVADAGSAAAQSTATATPSVDIEALLTDLASKAPEQLNWRQSIVDLMKMLELDSSLAARKQLAGELHYSGDTEDSAAMNIWLHKAVMRKLAENGGKVPDELKS
jgi:hypothetical protein